MARPTPRLLKDAARRFGVKARDLTFVRESANAIYAFTHAGKPAILRLTPGEGRDVAMIRGEVAFMDYLKAGGGHVPAVIRSEAGTLVETVGKGRDVFHVVAFARVPGTHPEGDALTADVLRLWGAALGRMHRLSQDYAPDPDLRRPDWHALDAFQIEDRLADADAEPDVLTKAEATLAAVRELPTGPADYGLIHADPEPWNLLVEGDRITFIDFDEACYHWYAFDVAVALLYAVLARDSADPGYPQRAWEALSGGYRTERDLSAFWVAQLPLLLRLRVLQDYAFSLWAWEDDPGDREDWQNDMLAALHRFITTNTLPFDAGFLGSDNTVL